MLRKLLAAIFTLSMVLTMGTIVQAEETVQKISTCDELNQLLRNGGSGILMNDVSDYSYPFSVNNNTSLDMNGHSIKGIPVTIQSGVKLSLSGSGRINYPVYIESSAELFAADTISFDYYVYFNGEGSRINGGTYNSKVSGQSKRLKYGIIDSGVFHSEVSNIDAVNGGTFNGSVRNSTIYDGTFMGSISDDCIIYKTVTFNSNGGSEVAEQKVLKGQQVSDPGSPVRDGYIFNGWYSNNALYDFSTPVTQNLTLTAQWIKSISGLTVSDIPAQIYSGADLTPVMTIKDDEYTLVQGQDYTVTYSDNRHVGTAKASVNGIGSYGGNIEKTFIIHPKEVTVSGIRVHDKVYDETASAVLDTSNAVINGKADNDDVSVNASGSFEDADAGIDKTVLISQSLEGTDAGNYVLNSVTSTIQADIRKADPLLSVQAVTTKTFSDNDFQLNISHKGDGRVSYSSDKPDVLSVSDTGLIYINGTGEAKIIVNLAESKNYISASHTLNINADKADDSIRIENAVINKTYGDPDFSIKPSDSVPGKVRYTIDEGDAVSIDGNGNVHINKPGTAAIIVSMDAAGSHRAVSETITIKVAAAPSVTLLPGINQKDYVITAGNKTDWQRSSGKQLLIISDGDYDLFNGLYIDENPVDHKNYDVKKGSTEIYLNSSYLETLSVGKHTFELKYSNGKTASGEFTIVESENKNPEAAVYPGKSDVKNDVKNTSVNRNDKNSSVPDTGDNTNSIAWGLIMMTAVICAVIITKKRFD